MHLIPQGGSVELTVWNVELKPTFPASFVVGMMTVGLQEEAEIYQWSQLKWLFFPLASIKLLLFPTVRNALVKIYTTVQKFRVK